jgi:nucleolar protein 58
MYQCSKDSEFEKTDVADIHDAFFQTASSAHDFLQLVSFQPFADTADAVSAAASCMDGSVGSSLQKFLKKQLKHQNTSSECLAVADPKLGVSIKESCLKGGKGKEGAVAVVHNPKTLELFRGIRLHLEDLLGRDTISHDDIKAMQLGLSHSLSRYKLKFSADRVDTMVIQAVGLLDELDKEINTYAMRVKEWYGWHFPELQGIIVGDTSNAKYAQLVLKCGFRNHYRETDLSQIIQDETTEAAIKEAAEVSMGTEVADLDIVNIQSLAEQVLSLTEYRLQLFEYLKNRMNAIAPNLTILVGELVGARLIAHAGSLMNLAKYPASTVQILGAEKALFRALKTKHDTPKYGLIYHASLVGQASAKNKGKISRVLAAKASLGIRVDALSDDVEEVDTTIGFEGRGKVEARLRQLEGGGGSVGVNGNLSSQRTAKYNPVVAKAAAKAVEYKDGSEMILDTTAATTTATQATSEEKEEEKKKAKKEKKKKKRKADELMDDNDGNDEAEKKAAKKAAKKAKKEKRKSKE